jgi:hypothetical protein
MIISDGFDALSTTQVLNLINLAKKTGTLRVFDQRPTKKTSAAKTRHTSASQKGAGRQAEIYFEDGLVISASLGGLEYHLAGTLQKAGKLSQQRLRALLKYTANFTDRQLALVLIDRGYTTKQDILKAVKQHTLNIIMDVMSWSGKKFEFHDAIPDLSGHILVPINPKDIIADAARQTYDTQRLEKAVPDLNLALKFAGDPAEKFKEVDLTADEWRVVGFINTNKTVQQIARACNMTDIEIRRVVFALQSAGIVELEGVSNIPSKNGNGFHRDNLRKLESQVMRLLNMGISSRQEQDDIDWISDQLASDGTRGDPEGLFKDELLQLGTQPRSAPAEELPPAPVRTAPGRSETALRRGKSTVPRPEPIPVSPQPEKPQTPPPPLPISPKPERPTQEARPVTVSQEMRPVTITQESRPVTPTQPQVPKAKPSPSQTPAESPELTDMAVQTLVMRPVKEVDLANHERQMIAFPKDGWLILDFGKKQFTLATNRMLVIGRNPTNTTHAIVDVSSCGGLEKGVSRNHVAIFVAEDGGLVISDLGSKNGTFINEKKLASLEPYRLYDGDTVRLGDLEVQVYYLAKLDTAVAASVAEQSR